MAKYISHAYRPAVLTPLPMTMVGHCPYDFTTFSNQWKWAYRQRGGWYRQKLSEHFPNRSTLI